MYNALKLVQLQEWAIKLSIFIRYKIVENSEFDPGSGWTLAVYLTHASQMFLNMANGWVMYKNLP